MKPLHLWLYDFFNLHDGQEEEHTTLEQVSKNVSLRGAHIWTLACAILIASVGLNMNSTAVVIGAMLISPLMGPIISAGFALGVYDFSLMRRAVRNIIVATVVSIFVSAVYFYLTPFKEVQSELLARTSPNFFDIIIAFAGGIVGIIAVTRVEKGNPLPGVAIATALMPPLCTAGYGIATGNLTFFFGAFYLYVINSVFIFLATFLIVRHLRYPLAQYIDLAERARIKRILTGVTMVILIPAVWLAYGLFAKQQFITHAGTFLDVEFSQTGGLIISKSISYTPEKKIEALVLGRSFSETDITSITARMEDYSLPTDTILTIRQSTEYSDIASLKNSIKTAIDTTDTILTEKDLTIQNLQSIVARNTYDNASLLAELQVFFPDITAIEITNPQWSLSEEKQNTSLVGFYTLSGTLSDDDISKMSSWLIQRMSIENIDLYQRANPDTDTGSATVLSDSGEILTPTNNTGEILPNY